LKRHFFQVEIKRSLPNIKDFFTKKQLHGHLEMFLLLAKIKKINQCIKNYEEGQYSYFQLLNIKNPLVIFATIYTLFEIFW
jgi:hypothetical protein